MYEIGEAEIEAVARVIRSGRLFRYQRGESGPTQTERFEEQWAAKMGMPHALAVATGTSALTCALIGLGIAPGDEVILPGYTFMATALAPLAIGAVPVLAEVDAGLTLDPEDVARKITPRTRAIVPVHMNGHLANLAPLVELARAKGLALLEDACQCDGGSYRGRRAGSWGDAGAFSFNCFKIISCGEGGAAVFRTPEAWQRARIYHDTGCAWREDAGELRVPLFAGINCRMDELRAAVLCEQLRRLDPLLARLRAARRRLKEALAADTEVEFAPTHEEEGNCGIALLLRVAGRDEALRVAEEARARKLPLTLPFDSGRHVYANWEPLMRRCGAHHPRIDPLHTTAAGRAQRYAPDMLPQTLEHLRRTVMVSVHPDWDPAQTAHVAAGIRACLHHARCCVT